MNLSYYRFHTLCLYVAMPPEQASIVRKVSLAFKSASAAHSYGTAQNTLQVYY